MSWPDIREQVAAIFAGVDGAGVVHPYQRHAATWEKFLSHFKDPESGRIQGACISRVKIEEPEDTDSHNRTRHFVRIRYYRGLRDS